MSQRIRASITPLLLTIVLGTVVYGQGNERRLQQALTLARSELASERLAAARALGSPVLPQAATDALVLLIADKQMIVRAAAAGALGDRGDPSAIRALLQAAKVETVPDILDRINESLRRLRRSSNEVALVRAEPDPEQREQWARLAAYSSSATDALVILLDDPVPAVRNAAIASLVIKRNATVVPILLRTLDLNPDLIEKRRAIEGLGEIKAATAVAPLIRALADPSLREPAIAALGEIGDGRSAPAIASTLRPPQHTDWYVASLALTKLGDAGFAALAAVLADRDEGARIDAIRGMVLFKDKRAVTALLPLLQDTATVARGETALALAHLGDTDAVPPLLVALRRETLYVEEAILIALGRLKDPRALPALIGHLGNRSAIHHQAAAEALVRIGGDRAEEALFAALRAADLSAVRGTARYFVALGRDGSDTLLARVLDPADPTLRNLAEIYLTSGNPVLVARAREWATRQRVAIAVEASNPVSWKQGRLPR